VLHTWYEQNPVVKAWAIAKHVTKARELNEVRKAYILITQLPDFPDFSAPAQSWFS
jgi:hypothetical protein